MPKPRTVAVTPKPEHVAALRSTWRKSAQQRLVQLWRFLRLTVSAFALQVAQQVITQLVSDSRIDVNHLTRKAVLGILIGAVEVVWRQQHPALTAAAADSAPGVTIVPAEVAP
jgi:hypothetical protein